MRTVLIYSLTSAAIPDIHSFIFNTRMFLDSGSGWGVTWSLKFWLISAGCTGSISNWDNTDTQMSSLVDFCSSFFKCCFNGYVGSHCYILGSVRGAVLFRQIVIPLYPLKKKTTNLSWFPLLPPISSLSSWCASVSLLDGGRYVFSFFSLFSFCFFIYFFNTAVTVACNWSCACNLSSSAVCFSVLDSQSPYWTL